MSRLALVSVLLLAGCHTDRLRSAGGGYEIRSRATAEQARELALAVAEEMELPARERDGFVEIELAVGPPMSERFSRWLRVTVTPRGSGTLTRIDALAPIQGAPRTPSAHPSLPDAYLYADRLAERLAAIR